MCGVYMAENSFVDCLATDKVMHSLDVMFFTKPLHKFIPESLQEPG
jgi:hypothetical protein